MGKEFDHSEGFPKMTTIGYDGRVLCADTAHWQNDTLAWNGDKIHTVTDRAGNIVVAYATAGDYAFALITEQKILDLLDGKPVEPLLMPDNRELSILVIDMRDKDPYPYIITDDMILMPAGVPIALGSGGEIALAAMRCGKKALDAVELACATNAYTRGPITAIDCKKRKYTHTLEEAVAE
jgi:hypothetical protein